jgi:hypothetical protein
MEREDIERDESISANQEETSQSLDTPARGDSPMLFEFVTNSGDSKSQIRRHAMRESWRQRNRGRSNSPATHKARPRARELLPRAAHTRQSSSSTGKEAAIISDLEMDEDAGRGSESLSSSEDESLDSEIVKRERLLTPDGVFLDLRHTVVSVLGPEHSTTSWSLSTITTDSGQRPSPYQSIGDAEIDPFNSIKLSREDKKLLRHCKLPVTWVESMNRY